MEKNKTRRHPAIIRNKATIEGWLRLLEKNSGVLIRKDYHSIPLENNYLIVFKLCAYSTIIRNRCS